MKTDKTRPIAIYMGYRSDTNLCIAHSWIPPHTYTHCARYSLPLLMTHNIYPPASIPPCTLLPVQCVVQTPTDSTHHLMDFLRRIHAHEHTHTQLESVWCALRTELVGIKLSLSLSLSLWPLMVCRPQKEKGRQSQSQCTKDWTASERVLRTKIQISPSSSQLELAFLPGACREGRLWH